MPLIHEDDCSVSKLIEHVLSTPSMLVWLCKYETPFLWKMEKSIKNLDSFHSTRTKTR